MHLCLIHVVANLVSVSLGHMSELEYSIPSNATDIFPFIQEYSYKRVSSSEQIYILSVT